MADLRAAALWYARRGLWVFACVTAGKTPATAHGCNDATIDSRTVARMWSAGTCNVGIACGPSGLVVLDVDGADGATALDALQRQHGTLPTTPEVSTRRGRHLYFAHDHAREQVRNSAGKLGPGLDVRGFGGYVLAPPSLHPDGHRYTWAHGRGIHELAIAPLPEWLRSAHSAREPERLADVLPRCVDLAPAHGRERSYARAALSRECQEVLGAHEGTRNARLNTAAFNVGQLVGAGWLDARLARGALIHAGVHAGLGQREAIKTVNSGLSAGERQPRQIAEQRAHG